MEEKIEVKAFKVDFKCPKCNEGYLRPTGQRYLTNPPKYPHLCNKVGCGYAEIFLGTYPHIIHE